MPRITIHAVYQRKGAAKKLNIIEFEALSIPIQSSIERIATSHIKHFDYTLAGYELVQLIGHETKEKAAA